MDDVEEEKVCGRKVEGKSGTLTSCEGEGNKLFMT